MITIITPFFTKVFCKKDFIHKEISNNHLGLYAAKRFSLLIEVRLTSKATYGNKSWDWGNIIVQKTVEMA